MNSKEASQGETLKPRQVIALCGRAGAGKTYIANVFDKAGFKRLSFAAAIKRGAAAMFAFAVPEGFGSVAWHGLTKDDRKWRERHNQALTDVFGRPMTPRLVLQELGTEVGRAWCNDIWINITIQEITADNYNQLFIIDDCRFDNEAAAVIRIGGCVWQIEGHGVKAYDPHSSEGGISEAYIDAFIKNDHSAPFDLAMCRLAKDCFRVPRTSNALTTDFFEARCREAESYQSTQRALLDTSHSVVGPW